MAINIPAYSVVATKMSTTDTPKNVRLEFYDAVGGLHFCAMIPGADFTSLNTTVNGGAAGATLTVGPYAEDASYQQYPQGYGARP